MSPSHPRRDIKRPVITSEKMSCLRIPWMASSRSWVSRFRSFRSLLPTRAYPYVTGIIIASPPRFAAVRAGIPDRPAPSDSALGMDFLIAVEAAAHVPVAVGLGPRPPAQDSLRTPAPARGRGLSGVIGSGLSSRPHSGESPGA